MDAQEKAEEQPMTGDDGGNSNPAGDPGLTPGSAEGDEETVDEAIAQHERKGDQ
jgi:hypothetical protein